MYKSRLHRITIMMGLVLGMCIIAACGQSKVSPVEKPQGGFVKIAPGAYDSQDTAVVISKQEEEKKIIFLNLKKKRKYTLNYDGITRFTDKYGSQISASQLQEGEIVDVQFLKDEKLLSSLMISPDVWTMNEVSRYELDLESGVLIYMDKEYTIDENTVIFSDGKFADLSNIGDRDKLSVKGMGRNIYSINIETGHGYLCLENEDYFIGGWIEVGQKIIHRIEENMQLVVPEGSYSVYLSHGGIEGTKEVEIVRNQETRLDVGDLKKEELIKYGKVTITVEPSGAAVYVDGNRVDVSKVIKATYGLHQIMAKADGYDTVTQYIRVNENGTKVALSLDEKTVRTDSANSTKPKKDSKTSDTVSGNSVSNNNVNGSVSDNEAERIDFVIEKNSSISENSTDSQSRSAESGGVTDHKVTVKSPENMLLYVDDVYMGVIPISFDISPGNHEFAIRKQGYITRIYTVDVNEENREISYSFSELKPSE